MGLREKAVRIAEGAATSFGCLIYGTLSLVGVIAWCTHIVVCFREHYFGFLIAGAIFFPIAIIHGIGLWFGWWH
jgi:hypothetical protein